MNRIIIIILGVLLTALIVVSNYAFNAYHQKNRLEDNQRALLSEVEVIKMENGRYKTDVHVLQLTNKELKAYKDSFKKDVEDLGIKFNQVLSIAKNSTETNTSFKTYIKDSVINDTVKIGTFNYNDSFTSVKGEIYGDIVSVNISSRDSIIQVVYDERSAFRRIVLFWTKPVLKQTISASNPNCQIKYSEYIHLTNKKGK